VFKAEFGKSIPVVAATSRAIWKFICGHVTSIQIEMLGIFLRVLLDGALVLR